VDEGYARLPGEGYAALHPELKDIDPEDYPDIHKLAILADVAPYSRQYNTYRQRIGRQAQGNTELEIEYEKILARVKKTRESVIRMTDWHYTEPVDEISGTVESASPRGITLKEFPGRHFQFSSVSTSTADMSARILGEKNDMTRSLRPAGHKNPRAPAPEAPPLQTCSLPARTRASRITRLPALHDPLSPSAHYRLSVLVEHGVTIDGMRSSGRGWSCSSLLNQCGSINNRMTEGVQGTIE
jgi:hypothetical protein